MVARGALADASVTLVGKPKFAEITTGHNDKRTIGIVKVIGSAMVGVGEAAMIIYNEKKSANRTPKESNPQDRLVIQVRAGNSGAVAFRSGVPVSLYTNEAEPQHLGTTWVCLWQDEPAGADGFDT